MHWQAIPLTVVTVCALFAFTKHEGLVNVFGSSLVREIRYTKFNMNFVNSSVGTTHSGIRSVRNKHMLYIQFNTNRTFTKVHMKVSISKCKEYYIDCENVILFNITNFCPNFDSIKYYVKTEGEFKITDLCPIHGEKSFTNFTINADYFGAMFSFPTEKWWELYWRTWIKLYDQKNSEFLKATCDFYFVQFRSHHH
ncbi:uncharacterized protein LOC112685966 [Sipha flava]|uniref:Uncharacterized protein LOC112685966 n=1 Tax=Sipha flava TaxID=143950 RepID=A0A2S2QP30_9HEMI|nr:uncharacterized protein LOC112685966 [Sipha flava]